MAILDNLRPIQKVTRTLTVGSINIICFNTLYFLPHYQRTE